MASKWPQAMAKTGVYYVYIDAYKGLMQRKIYQKATNFISFGKLT